MTSVSRRSAIFAAAALFGVAVDAFVVVIPHDARVQKVCATTATTTSTTRTTSSLRMGLFDGVKDAFSAPALERSTLDSERETPIDRWMGWSVSSDKEQEAAAAGTSCS